MMPVYDQLWVHSFPLPSTPLQSYSPLVPIRTWMAHSAEVTSLQLIGLEREPLVLSASADATVRLWTLKGHYIGTFGQGKAWDLDQPSSFQHPKWGMGGHTLYAYIHIYMRSLYIVLYMLCIRMCMCVLQYICICSVYVVKCSVLLAMFADIHTYVHNIIIIRNSTSQKFTGRCRDHRGV